MTTDERAQQVRRWYSTMVELERQCDEFTEITMAHPESPLMRAVNMMAGDYTEAVDPGGDCAWFWIECDLGRRLMQASKADGDERTIKTVEDLIWLMQ